jgi:hypothetical protein
MTDAEALDAIVEIMSGQEWDVDTLDAVAQIVESTGRKVLDIFGHLRLDHDHITAKEVANNG